MYFYHSCDNYNKKTNSIFSNKFESQGNNLKSKNKEEEEELTNDGQDDDNKVKDVPSDCEEVASQPHDFNEALRGEDDNEGQVDVVEDLLHPRRLLVRFYHHGDHVQEDQHHDDDVERLFSNQVEEESLQRVLKQDVPMKKLLLRTVLFTFFNGLEQFLHKYF